MGEERRGKGGKAEKKKERDGKMRSHKDVVFLVIISLNTCSFFCTLIASWQVGLAAPVCFKH